jgi:hypothetical protein
MSTFTGKCHCENVAFAYRTALAPRDWSVRACQCTFCRRHGALSTSDPAGSIEFTIADPANVIRYRFGKRLGDFLICGCCGIYIAACMQSPRGRFAVINLNALDPVPGGLAKPEPMDYDTETPEQRTGRRERRWTPVIGTL